MHSCTFVCGYMGSTHEQGCVLPRLHICMWLVFVCLLSVCADECVSVCLAVCLCVCMHICVHAEVCVFEFQVCIHPGICAQEHERERWREREGRREGTGEERREGEREEGRERERKRRVLGFENSAF